MNWFEAKCSVVSRDGLICVPGVSGGVAEVFIRKEGSTVANDHSVVLSLGAAKGLMTWLGAAIYEAERSQ